MSEHEQEEDREIDMEMGRLILTTGLDKEGVRLVGVAWESPHSDVPDVFTCNGLLGMAHTIVNDPGWVAMYQEDEDGE